MAHSNFNSEDEPSFDRQCLQNYLVTECPSDKRFSLERRSVTKTMEWFDEHLQCNLYAGTA